jgi:peptidoglycan LD-endopeptidase LytH
VNFQLTTNERGSSSTFDTILHFYFYRLADLCERELRNTLLVRTKKVILRRQEISSYASERNTTIIIPSFNQGDGGQSLRKSRITILSCLFWTVSLLAQSLTLPESSFAAQLVKNHKSRTAGETGAPDPQLSDQQRLVCIRELRKKNLLFPLEGIDPKTIKGSYYETRGGVLHEASDILSPRNTPVHAIEDGVIVKLFQSRFGGTTIYQFDPTSKYVYYYAHLERYAVGLKDGDKVKRGQIIGYVGTSGNAPKNTPHLHLSISVLGPDRRWWSAAPVDPYAVFQK